MNKIKLTALPCICADVFYGTEIIRPGGEALNFAAHASHTIRRITGSITKVVILPVL